MKERALRKSMVAAAGFHAGAVHLPKTSEGTAMICRRFVIGSGRTEFGVTGVINKDGRATRVARAGSRISSAVRSWS